MIICGKWVKFAVGSALVCGTAFLVSCAAERQGVVCDEIEYRLNTLTYSPDQRAFQEEELQACRAEEAQKKGEAAAKRQSIYDRFAADSTKSDKMKVAEDGSIMQAGEPEDVSVSKALKDSSGETTTSIYDRYKAVGPADSVATPAETPAAENPAAENPVVENPAAPVDTSAVSADSFQ